MPGSLPGNVYDCCAGCATATEGLEPTKDAGRSQVRSWLSHSSLETHAATRCYYAQLDALELATSSAIGRMCNLPFLVDIPQESRTGTAPREGLTRPRFGASYFLQVPGSPHELDLYLFFATSSWFSYKSPVKTRVKTAHHVGLTSFQC